VAQSVFKILVLEDDPDLREMVVDVLDEQGYQVTAVSSGEQAVGLADSEAFDLFIADIRMEGMGGLKAIEQAQGMQSDLGSLVISGWASEEETLEAVRLQVGGYLKKPFSMSDLIERVKFLLTQKSEQQRREKEKMAMKSAVFWSMQTLAHLSDEAALLAPRGALSRVETVAGRLAEMNGLRPFEVQEVEVGAAVAALLEVGDFQPPGIVERTDVIGALLEVLRGFRGSLKEKPDLSIVSQIGGLAVVCALRDPEEPLPSVEEIRTDYPQRFSDELLTQYESLGEQPQKLSGGRSPEVMVGLHDPQRIRRSLLSLARAMESVKDNKSAAVAYRKLLEKASTSYEATSACLGLARVALMMRDKEQAAQWALEASRRAKPAGPSAFGQAALECGLLLQQIEHSQAKASLGAAQKYLTRVGLVGSAAIARIALEDYSDLEQTLETLGSPTQWDQVSKSATHVLPRLLKHWKDEPPWPKIERLILAFADSLKEMESGLESRSKLHLIEILAKHKDRASVSLLETLARSDDPKVRALASQLLSDKGQSHSNPFIKIHSLGFFEVFLGPERVDDQKWRTQKTKYLLAYLLTRFGRPLRAEEIAELFWPESRAKADQNLWAATSAARRVIKPGDYILREGDNLSFDWDTPYWHDYEELTKALDQLEKISFEEQSELYGRLSQKVAQLYTGPYLDGCFMDWAVRIRGQLEFAVSDTLVKGAHSFLRRQLYSEALEMADRALEVDPLRGEAFLMKMRSHLGLCQPELTISCYDKAEAMLKREFGLEPPMNMVEILTRARHGLPDPGN
jgi:two-component SAPR family response regulator